MIHNIFTKILDFYKDSLLYQNNRKHRNIVNVDFVDLNNGFTDVIVTSCCNKTIINKVNLFRTIRKFTDEDKLNMINKSEKYVYNTYYKNDFDEFICQLDYLYSSDNFSYHESKENNRKYFDDSKDYFIKNLKREAYYILMKE